MVALPEPSLKARLVRLKKRIANNRGVLRFRRAVRRRIAGMERRGDIRKYIRRKD